MGRQTVEELEIIALIERMQDRRLTAAEAAIALAQAFALGGLSEPPDDMPDVMQAAAASWLSRPPKSGARLVPGITAQ
jgi:hypothetical protein